MGGKVGESRGTATNTNECDYEGRATLNVTEKPKQPPKTKTQPTWTTSGGTADHQKEHLASTRQVLCL